MRQIAIVTPDILGPVFNGGIGTAYWEIANLLVREGHRVTIFFIPPLSIQVDNFDHWQRMYQDRGITLLPIPHPKLNSEGMLSMRRANAVYEHLRSCRFDIIHFPDMGGLGFYCLLAKKMGLDFQSTILAVQVHGPTSWHAEFNADHLSNQNEVCIDYLERKSLEYADHVLLADASIESWFEKKGWSFSGVTKVLPLPCRELELPKIPGTEKSKIEEFVFFGRLETRKGVEIFCDALDMLSGEENNFRVRFIGKPSRIQGRNAMEYLRDRASGWNFNIEITTNWDRETSLRDLRRGRRLVILPSRAETFGYTLSECLFSGIPFLASDIPPFRNQLSAESRNLCLFDGSSEDLSLKMMAALRHGVSTAQPANSSSADEAWRHWHSSVEQMPFPAAKDREPNIFVSVCITHRDRAELLHKAILSLHEQSYQNFEVILVDDGSSEPSSHAYLESMAKEFAEKKWHILKNPQSIGAGAARNLAVQKAKGDYVLLMDDDNLAKPDEIEIFAKAAQKTDADILTCFFDRLVERGRGKSVRSQWLALGDDLSYGFMANGFGDTNSFIKRTAYLKLGGMKEDPKLGCEDWEFFARAVTKGFRLLVVPRALFLYREHAGCRTWGLDSFRSLEFARSPYNEILPNGALAPLLSFLGNQIGFEREKSPKTNATFWYQPLQGSLRGNIFLNYERFKKILFSSERGFGTLRWKPLKDIDFVNESQHLDFISKGEDPAVEIAGLDLQNNNRLVMDFDFEASCETEFQLFYLTEANPNYEEKFSVSRNLVSGRNSIQIFIEGREVFPQFRLDPAKTKGSFRLLRFEVRGEG